MHVMDWEEKISLGFGVIYHEYTGGFYSKSTGGQVFMGWEMANVRRGMLSVIVYPLTIDLLRKNLQFSIGFQRDILLKNKTSGQALHWRDSMGFNLYDKYSFKYDTFGLNRMQVTGTVISVSANILVIGKWTLKPRYSLYCGLGKEFDTYSSIVSVRNMLEISLSRVFTNQQ